MNTAAIYHISDGRFCYPLDSDRLCIKLQTGCEVSEAELVWGDPFSSGLFGSDSGWEGEHVLMENTACLSQHKIWQAVVKPKFKRCRYYFIVKTPAETVYFIESGFRTIKEFRSYKGRRQDFFFPWMNEADIIKPAEWVNNTVWYQIFPDRFCSSGKNTGVRFHQWQRPDRKVSNMHLYGGDLDGVRSRLNHLKDLGVGGIYFTPINESNSNHKYNTTDYNKIDPDFGTSESMKLLVSCAHERGIRVMLDGVFNHCGTEFAPWQDVLKKGRESEYFDWFMINKYPFSKIGGKTRRGEYYSFAFVDEMPKLNTNNDEVIDYFIDVCSRWVKEYDIDALRLDVANELSHKFNRRLREAMLRLKPDFYIIGEIWNDSSAWLRGDEYDAVMNYSLQETIESFWRNESMTAEQFMYETLSCFERYAKQTCDVMFNLLDSHDTMRLITRCGGDENAFYQELCALFTLNGTVCIYYGTEIALEGGHDPDCRRCMPWNEIESGKYDDRIGEMKRLISLRKSIPELRSGTLKFINSGNDRVIVYDKSSESNTYRVVLNVSGSDYTVEKEDHAVYSRGLDGNILRHGGAAVIKL